MDRSRPMRLWLVAMVLLIAFTGGILAVAQDASEGRAKGFVVILKNKQRIRAREPMKIVGKQVFITLITGTMTAIPLNMVDIVATERYNKLGLGDALTIEGLDFTEAPVATPTPRTPLGSIVSIHAGTSPVLGASSTPTPTPTPGIRLQTTPYPNKNVDKAFKQIFDSNHLYLYRTSIGTQPGYYFVQAITDSEREVFLALETVCKAFAIIQNLHPELAPKAVELEMRTTSGKPAGTFRLTPDIAQELNSGKLSPEQFYVTHVIF